MFQRIKLLITILLPLMLNYLKRLFSFFFILYFSLVGFSQNEQFTHLNSTDGLPINTIKHITQDYLGFVWIATQDGICRYDGSDIKVYKNTKEDLFSYGNNEITYVFEDSNKDLWLCTARGGLAKYDRKNDRFENYNSKNDTRIKNLHTNTIIELAGKKLLIGTDRGLSYFDLTTETYYKNEKQALLQNEKINTLFRAKNNSIWIGSAQRGLENFDVKEGTIQHYSTKADKPYRLAGNGIKAIVEDSLQRIWVGTWANGLHKITKDSITIYKHGDNDKSSISQNAIFALAITKKGKLWIATENKGICHYDEENKSFHSITSNFYDARGLSDNAIQSLYIDSRENLWVGTFAHGVSILPQHPFPFKHIKSIPGEENSLSNNNVISILKDKKGRLWIGTDGGGLNLYDEEFHTFTVYRHYDEDTNTIGSNVVLSVYEDNEGTIWTGTYRGGLSRFNEETDDFTTFTTIRNDTTSLSNDIVSTIFEDKEGLFWVGTWRNGFNLFDKKTGTFTQFPYKRNKKGSIPHYQVNHMIEGDNNDLWIATEDGLVHFDKSTHQFEHYNRRFKTKNGISDNSVSSLYLNNKGILWIGTRGGGLNKFDPKTKLFTNYKGTGFSSDIIYHIIPENKTKLWISTNDGITEFDTETTEIRSHGFSEGVLGTQFVTGSGYKDENGIIFLGSTEGLNFFHPENIFTDKKSSPLKFTGLKIQNKEVDISTNKLMAKHISLSEEVTIKYKENFFSIAFSYLNYIYPDKTQYEYKMVGFDKEWIKAGNKNVAHYTNLDPNEYTFMVRATNKADHVIEPITMKVTVRAPFYMTVWFRSLLVFLTGLLIYGLFQMRINEVKEKRKILLKNNKVLQKEIKQRKKTQRLYKKEKIRAIKLAEAKDEFLSNMSHEIRTPLNMILGYLQLVGTNKTNIVQFLKVMRVSADNLLHLVNQILDLSKIEKDKLDLNFTPFNTREYIEELKGIFTGNIEMKGLDFIVEVDKNLPHTVIGDKHRLNQILTNLLGNALKFTEKGHVKLKIDLSESKGNHASIKFIVKDTGIGIAKEKLDTVFEKFTQEKSTITREFGGTGLGLTIAKELISLLKGKIEVDSIQGKGSEFAVSLPFEIATENITAKSSLKDEPKSIKGLHILVVDDNQFNLTLASTIIQASNATVKTAISGPKALKLMEEEYFDAVVMDIHMPEMNGYEATQQITKKYRTPVIGCTADIFNETFEKGIKSGMVDIITKPFQINHLIEKIHIHSTIYRGQNKEQIIANKQS